MIQAESNNLHSLMSVGWWERGKEINMWPVAKSRDTGTYVFVPHSSFFLALCLRTALPLGRVEAAASGGRFGVP